MAIKCEQRGNFSSKQCLSVSISTVTNIVPLRVNVNFILMSTRLGNIEEEILVAIRTETETQPILHQLKQPIR